MDLVFYLYFLNIVIIVYCGYPPTGDEVQAGSVLLPASRRGRYLANIVRRQAVDGTGIKFNKDADRMNAEAKKKVDVLSDELLPYIIAEQERRITLYKRVMAAIQNGEKGVTVAELRKKPPLIIRKGLMYRCPSNRGPKEPDGTGIIMCEEDIEPTPVMYDSCLSAEDKELYVAENKYFFCNRHRVEGPDLPRNGSTVVACSPLERTSLNYTTIKCALEDTDDVVVHYRYYPDRTYKFATELDPDREVCDHWDPCQIGYIYSLPSPDQAIPANELWQYEKDIVDEFVYIGEEYETNMRKIKIPPGYEYHGIGRWDQQTNARVRLTAGPFDYIVSNVQVSHQVSGKFLKITIRFSPFKSSDVGSYYVRFGNYQNKQYSYRENVLVLHDTMTQLKAKKIDQLIPGQHVNKTIIHMKCNHCTLLSVVERNVDGSVLIVDTSKYTMKSYTDQSGIEKHYIELNLEDSTPEEFGDYYAIIQNEDGTEEKIKMFSLNDITVEKLKAAIEPGTRFDGIVNYQCSKCELTDVICNGESVLASGRVSIAGTAKQVNFNIPSFEDVYSCVYIGVFKDGDRYATKKLALLENGYVQLLNKTLTVMAPKDDEPFDELIYFTCEGDCTVEKVTLNGMALEQVQDPNGRRSFSSMRSHSGRRFLWFIPFFTAAAKAVPVAAKLAMAAAKAITSKKVVTIYLTKRVVDKITEPGVEKMMRTTDDGPMVTDVLVVGDYIAVLKTNEGSISKKILEVCASGAECEDFTESTTYPDASQSTTYAPTTERASTTSTEGVESGTTEAGGESTTSIEEAESGTTEARAESTTSTEVADTPTAGGADESSTATEGTRN